MSGLRGVVCVMFGVAVEVVVVMVMFCADESCKMFPAFAAQKIHPAQLTCKSCSRRSRCSIQSSKSVMASSIPFVAPVTRGSPVVGLVEAFHSVREVRDQVESEAVIGDVVG